MIQINDMSITLLRSSTRYMTNNLCVTLSKCRQRGKNVNGREDLVSVSEELKQLQVAFVDNIRESQGTAELMGVSL